MNAMMIDFQNVSKTFPGQKALDNLSFQMESGTVHCVLGQNGCGKSTLIKILSGYHIPDSESVIEVGGKSLSFGRPQDSASLGLRFVHQQNGVIGELTALENLALGVGYSKRWARIDWREERRRARASLALVGRADLDLDSPMSSARAVDRAAVAIARASDPRGQQVKFLCLDEPTAALPVSEVDLLMNLVVEVRQNGIGVVYVTHRLDEVFRIGDAVTVLRDGHHIATRAVDGLNGDELIELITGQSDSVAMERHLGTGVKQEATIASLSVSDLRTGLLDGIALDLYPGEVVGVAGLDGSGREEICAALVGAIPVEYEHLSVAGASIVGRLTPRLAKRKGLALAMGNRQKGSAVREFNLRENITLPSIDLFQRLLWVDRQAEKRAASAWVDRLRIRTSRNLDPSSAAFTQLSGGNQQKVVLAKWLATEPKALLLEEPTSGVDVGAREAIYEVIREQADRGMGVLLASSDIHDFLRICDRVLVVRNGRIAAEIAGKDLDESALLEALMPATIDSASST